MPIAELGCDEVQRVFIENIFRSQTEMKIHTKWELTAALLGAHTVGSAKNVNSGFEGQWSSDRNLGIFNNDYFKSLIMKGWKPMEGGSGEAKEGSGTSQNNLWIRAD